MPAPRLPGLGERLTLASLVIVADLMLTGLLAGWMLASTASEEREAVGLLPAVVAQAEPLPLGRAPVLRVAADGAVSFNGRPMESAEIVPALARYRAAAQAARTAPVLEVRADPATPFDRLQPVLAACTRARLGTVRLMY